MGKETTKAAPLTEEQLLKKEADLQAKSDKLEQDQKAFDQAKTDFLKAQIDHGKAVEAADLELNTRSSALDEREAALNAREAALDNATAEVKEEIVAGLSFDLEKEKFKFRDDAPKTILFDGKARTQKELVKDTEALLQLTSNQSLIEKVQ